MIFYFLFNWVISTQGKRATTRHGVIRKRSRKDQKHIGKLIKNKLRKTKNYLELKII